MNPKKDEVIETELDLDNPGRPVIEDYDDDETGDIEYEVVDDTPPQDRGRAPLPEDIKQELDSDDDDAADYSDKVRKRIDQMKKAWHDERRAKESALRERDEAARVAQMAYQDRQKYHQAIAEGDAWALDQAKQRALLQLENAKRSYRDAYEIGDAERMLEAQQALNTSTIEYDRVAQYRPRALQTQDPGVYQQQVPQQPVPQRPQPDPKVVDWSRKNTWFGSDDEMTSFALGVHQRLVKNGVDPTSDDYYERLDARIREVFPDKVGGTKRPSSTVVAPVGRSPRGKKVVLTQTQISLAKRLGLTPKEYAVELVKLEK